MKTQFIFIRSFSVLLIFTIALNFISCKKVAKEFSEKALTETTEKAAKELSKEATEKSLKALTKKEIKNIDWSELLKIIKKEDLNLYESISKLDRSFQKKLGKAINSDFEFYNALISSNTAIDEFLVFTQNSSKAMRNIDLFKYFTKSRDLERRFGVPNVIGNITLKEESGIIKILNNSDNSIMGELRDGVFFIRKPFKTGTNLLDKNSILKKTLIPNSVYKIKGINGLSYLYHVDDFGRFSKIEAKCINADELASNVILAKENFNLGSEWTSKLKKVRQTSKGNDIDASLIFKYADDGMTPLTVKADIKAANKRIVSESFENLDNLSRKVFSTAENASVLERFATKTGLTVKKKADLLSEMGQDEELAKLIHSNPELNIKRWLNTRNHVDKSKLARTAKGRMVPNGQVYAGNTYYFNPHLNSGLKARLKNGGTINLKKFGKLTYEDLIRLDKLYPDGVPFTKEGYPDFAKVAFKGKNGKTLKIDIGTLSGDSKKDIAAAEALFQKLGYTWESGYTWHHIENSTTLIRVPSAIHQLVDHAGGMSTHASQEVVKQAA